jgi:hypothetical protein
MRLLGVSRPILGALTPHQPCFAALDVSLEKTTIYVMSLDGTILREVVVTTDPDAIATCLAVDPERLERIGLEAGPLSNGWSADWPITASPPC